MSGNYELEPKWEIQQKLQSRYTLLLIIITFIVFSYVEFEIVKDYIPFEARIGMIFAIIFFIIMPIFWVCIFDAGYFYGYEDRILCLYFTLLMIFSFMISYNFVPHFFGLIHANGQLTIANVSTDVKSFQYPASTQEENYNVTTLYFQNNSAQITKGCICYSSVADQFIRFRKPRLFSFYSDLTTNETNQTYIKFPSIACGSSKNITRNDTIYYKIYGDLKLANQSKCPPEDNNFIMAFDRIHISFWKGAGFIWSYIYLAFIIFALYSVAIQRSNKNQLFYFYFGPFGILLFLYDLIFVHGCYIRQRNNNLAQPLM